MAGGGEPDQISRSSSYSCFETLRSSRGIASLASFHAKWVTTNGSQGS
jgi:hypothetical protein